MQYRDTYQEVEEFASLELIKNTLNSLDEAKIQAVIDPMFEKFNEQYQIHYEGYTELEAVSGAFICTKEVFEEIKSTYNLEEIIYPNRAE